MYVFDGCNWRLLLCEVESIELYYKMESDGMEVVGRYVKIFLSSVRG